MSVTLQQFKETDTVEARVTQCFVPTLDTLGDSLDDFFVGAWEAYPLGEVLYDTARSPMAGPVTRQVFRTSFFAIHDLFTRPGTFEFYMDVFKAIWGDDVVVDFVVPDPGELEINIEALQVEDYEALARRVEDNVYVFDEIVDEDGDNLIFRDTKGIKTQPEIDQLMTEIAPAGIFCTTTLLTG